MKSIMYLIRVEFWHVGRMANSSADALVEQGLDRASALFANTL